MSALRYFVLATATGLLALGHSSAAAQERPNSLKVNLTEEAEPDGKAWEDPARASFTIDPHGPDSLSAKLNLELVKQLTPDTADRQRSIKAFAVWHRESGGEDQQNNLEFGGAYSVDYDTRFLDEEESTADESSSFINLASRFSAAFARTAQYADLTSPACVATPSAPQCKTQHKESLRGSAAFNVFNPFVERDAPGLLPFSIQPQFGADVDWLLNNPLDASGMRIQGGYVSAKAGIAMSVFPDFDAPRWDIKASAKLRQRLFASDSRRPLIKESALLFEASATYYLLKPRTDNGWRAGVGVTYTRGDDPLTGVSNVNKFVLALRIGRY
jgi:hypothetical protein